ncbi:MAG: 23S rRNA (pseudouridine(1915)-N(3))-methyltransferase RlmH [Eubacteriales bacterium]
MLKLRIIAMGRLTVDAFRAACDDYQKRLSRVCTVTVVEPKPEALPKDPSPGDIARALEREAVRIAEAIPPRAAVVAMCVEGKELSSEEFAAKLEAFASSGVPEVCFLIGSSYGLAESLKRRADLRLSVSKMTFPHELFRVLLYEQLYRASEIQSGGRYHK